MPDLARTFCSHSKPIPIREQFQLGVGWARLARAMRLAPTKSLDFSRSNARGRSDLHSPDDAWTSQTHVSPGMLQDLRGTSAASSPFRQNGDSRLAATGSLGVSPADRRAELAACKPMHRHRRSARRGKCWAGRLTGRPRYSARRAKVGFGGIRRQPGDESGRHWCLGMKLSV